MLQKIGRNDPCPCGSGKKFKKCCLGKHASDLPFNLSGPFDDDPEYESVCAEIDEAEFDISHPMGLSVKSKIPCSSENEAVDLAGKFFLEGRRAGVLCLNGSYTVCLFD